MTEETSLSATDSFKLWLRDNGAKYDKIEWPSKDTSGGVRGATALDDIETNEHMLEIPIQLMISPPIALADPDVGSLLQSNRDILKGDLMLTVYVMYERAKGPASFYYPYLQILPLPGTIAHWSADELAELQVRVLSLSHSGSS
jgi:hypothetical protein